jgi:hypothetical protein
LLNAEIDALQSTHVIVKLEQFKNVETLQPMDQLLAEMHTLLNAELNQNATNIPQEDVEKTVMIKLNVPLILAILQVENVKMFLTTMHVTITMHVPLIDVLLKDASIPTRIVTITMHVPKTSVMLLPENVLLPLLFANLLSAKLENVIP